MAWKEIPKRVFGLKHLLPISIAAVIAAVMVRIIQLNVAVDLSTGFFSREAAVIPLLTLLILLYFVYAIIVLALHPMRLEHPYGIRNTLASGVITGAAALILIAESAIAIMEQSDTFHTLNWFSVFSKIIAGGVLLYHAYLFFRKAEVRLKNHAWLIFPVIWSLLELVEIFVQHTTVISISERVFDVLFMASLALFLLYYARFTAGVLREKQKLRLMLTAICTVMLGAVSTVPPLFCKLLEFRGIGQEVAFPSLSTLAMTVFAGWMSFLFVRETLIFSGWRRKKTVPAAVDCEYRYETVGIDNLYPKKRIWGRK